MLGRHDTICHSWRINALKLRNAGGKVREGFVDDIRGYPGRANATSRKLAPADAFFLQHRDSNRLASHISTFSGEWQPALEPRSSSRREGGLFVGLSRAFGLFLSHQVRL